MIRRRRLNSVWLPFGALVLSVVTAVGGSMPVGALVGSTNVTVDGEAPLPHTTLLSGDNLQVANGLAVVTLDEGNRMILGRGTEAFFLREEDAVSVSLAQGSLSLYHPESSKAFRVKAADATVTPVKGYRTLGEIAMVNGLLSVTAKDGVLRIERAGTTQQVDQGKTVKIDTTPAADPGADPQGNQHIKHILKLSPALLLWLGLAAETGFTIWAIVSATSGSTPTPVSPVLP